MVRLVLIGLLLALLTACGTTSMEPSNRLVHKGLALQLSQVQQQLTQQLKFSTPAKFEINRIQIAEKQPLLIGNLPAYRVVGTYDLAIKLSKKKINQPHNSFEIYLQRQKEGKTWRLARLQSSDQDKSTWRTYLIQ